MIQNIIITERNNEAEAQPVDEWIVTYNGPGNNRDSAFAITNDSMNNFYVTGLSFGIGTDYDYATVSYDIDGNQLWVARYDNSIGGKDSAVDIVFDENTNNIYVTGSSMGNGTGYDFATVAYDNFGILLWVERFNGMENGGDYAQSIALDSKGHVYVAGSSKGTGNGFDYTLVKYDKDGNELWVSRYNGPLNDDDVCFAMTIDKYDNIYLTGRSWGGFKSRSDSVTVAFDSNGTQTWVSRYNGPYSGNDHAVALTTDISGNIYAIGTSEGKDTHYDFVIWAYDALGNERWIYRYNGPDNHYDHANVIVTGSQGNIYVSGISDNVDGSYGHVTISLDSSGSELWVSRSTEDFSPMSIIVDSLENIYVTGGGYIGEDWGYVTIAYSALGNITWVEDYLMGGNASGIIYDSFGDIYITGESYGSGKNDFDFTTIKYTNVSINYPPIANAGCDQTIYIHETVKFDGSNSTDPNDDIISYEWDFGDGTPLGSGIKTTHNYSSIGVYNVMLTVTDSGGNSDNDTCVITIKYPPSSNYYYPPVILNQGWNFISIPTIQDKTDIQYVLKLMEGKFDAIQWYDPSEDSEHWKPNNKFKPFPNEFTDINHTMGFFTHITSPGETIFLFNGTYPSQSQSVTLSPGWNMVGFPSLEDKNRTAALNNLVFGSHIKTIYTFNAASETWEDVGENDCMEIGKGYWIYANSYCVWEVPL
jgi:hypothetical protein